MTFFNKIPNRDDFLVCIKSGIFEYHDFDCFAFQTLIYKQTKDRNETGSNLSLVTRLMVLSKRLERKRCCDATPGRCLGRVPSHYLCFAFLQNASSSSKDWGFWRDPRAWSVPKVKLFPTWAPLPIPKEMKASLSEVQAFKFILQNAASKLHFFKLQASNSIF